MILKNQSDANGHSLRRMFTSSARVGFEHILTKVLSPTGGRILIPNYIGFSEREGSGVFDPIASTGIPYEFYRLDAELAANVEDVRARLQRGGCQALLLIHYFGISQSDVEAIAALCREHGVVLVIDCAHCLPPLEGVGHYDAAADYSLYSIHKVLPTPAGGILCSHPRVTPPPPLATQLRMSERDLLMLANSNLLSVAETRKRNYDLLADKVAGIQHVEAIYPRRKPDDVPLNLPVRIQGRSRHETYTALRRDGVETMALYYQLIEAIDPTEHRLVSCISAQILNLPTHQDLSVEEVEGVAQALDRAVNS